MIKLKKILKEGFAWERNADGSLPTLADAAKTHQKNLQEQENLNLDPSKKPIGSKKRAFQIYEMDQLIGDRSLQNKSDYLNKISGDWFLTKPAGVDGDGIIILNIPGFNEHIEIPARAFAKLSEGDITEVLKDKDGNYRKDLKYVDNQNYQPKIELKNSKMGSGTNFTITVSIDGSTPFDIEFDEYDEVDDHGYEKAIYLMGVDDGGNEWGMEGSMAFHGELEDFDIDTLEKMEK